MSDERTPVELAYREGYADGYSKGLSDGHPRNCGREEPDEGWEYSDAKRALADAPAPQMPSIECMGGKLTTFDQVVGYISQLEMEAVRRRPAAASPAPQPDPDAADLAEVMRERDELRAEIAKHWDCPLSPAPRAAWTRQDWYKHAQAEMEGLVVRIDTWVCEGGEMPALLKLLGDLRTFLARQPAPQPDPDPDAAALAEMEARKDAAYLERNQVVAALAKAALLLGWPVAITRTAIEGWSEDWHGCVYITLPTGQSSWHFHDSQAYLFDGLPRADVKWDGHTTEQKYERLAALRYVERATKWKP